MAEQIVAVMLRDPEASEMVRCRALDDGTYIIQDVPVFNEQFGFGDVIEASAKGDHITAERLLESGEWSTYVLEPVTAEFQDEAIIAMGHLERLGCPVQMRCDRIVSIAVSNTRRAEVLEVVASGMQRNLWQATMIREK